MRKHFSNYIEAIAEEHKDIVFITGDLGYNALENLREKMGKRFINAGVAEQNMIGVAAGIASRGYRVVCYSIAPFVVYRCLEQMRNDVCFHNLPVFIAGNGGGYHYGALGSSHHALEDIAVLSGLPNINCYIPAFLDDMKTCMDEMFHRAGPSYLRLGVGKAMPANMAMTHFGAATEPNAKARVSIIAQSPVVNNIIAVLDKQQLWSAIDLFVVNKMPFSQLPDAIFGSIGNTRRVLTVEEHIASGGIGAAVALACAEQSLQPEQFIGLHAKGYPNGLYGNQGYHQQVSGIDAAGIESSLSQLLN